MHQLTSHRTAAAALVEQLLINGVEHVFCVPGESFLAVLDALRDSSMTVTVCRHEGAAAMMAEAIGKTTDGRVSALSRAAPARPMRRQASISPSRIRRQ